MEAANVWFFPCANFVRIALEWRAEQLPQFGEVPPLAVADGVEIGEGKAQREAAGYRPADTSLHCLIDRAQRLEAEMVGGESHDAKNKKKTFVSTALAI